MSSRPTAGGACQQDAEDVGRGVVRPPLRRLERQRQRGEPRQDVLGRQRGRLRPGGDTCLVEGLGQRGVLAQDAEAARHGEQVADEDRAAQRLCLIEPAVRLA